VELEIEGRMCEHQTCLAAYAALHFPEQAAEFSRSSITALQYMETFSKKTDKNMVLPYLVRVFYAAHKNCQGNHLKASHPKYLLERHTDYVAFANNPIYGSPYQAEANVVGTAMMLARELLTGTRVAVLGHHIADRCDLPTMTRTALKVRLSKSKKSFSYQPRLSTNAQKTMV